MQYLMDSEGTTLAEALATFTTFERFFLAMNVPEND
jgi:hypothetical protein